MKNWLKILPIIVVLGGSVFVADKYLPKTESEPETAEVQGEQVVQEEVSNQETTPTSTPEQTEIEKLKAELEQLKNQPSPQPQAIIREKEIIREVPTPAPAPVEVAPPPPAPQPQPVEVEAKKYSEQDLKNWNEWNKVRNQIEQIYANMLVSIGDGISALKVRDYNTAHTKFANGASIGVSGLSISNNLPLISAISETAEYKQAWKDLFTAESSYSYAFMLIVETENNGYSADYSKLDPYDEKADDARGRMQLYRDKIILKAESLGLP